MFNSKYYLIVIVIAFLCLAGSVGIQVLEMKEYNLLNSLPNRFLKKAATAETPAKTEAAKAAPAGNKAADEKVAPAPAEKK
ncbi:MAG: hypothetical protein WCI51_07265 [Lentisphaerota bacterium]